LESGKRMSHKYAFGRAELVEERLSGDNPLQLCPPTSTSPELQSISINERRDEFHTREDV